MYIDIILKNFPNMFKVYGGSMGILVILAILLTTRKEPSNTAMKELLEVPQDPISLLLARPSLQKIARLNKCLYCP
jgi:hypothetical protein